MQTAVNSMKDAAALSALQSASATYHRHAVQTFAGDASTQRVEIQTALESLDIARRALDAVRERKPWRH